MARRDVLSLFKRLHRTAQTVFRGDQRALVAARDKIFDEFGKNKGVTSPTAIEELVSHGNDVNQVLRESVVQAEKVDDSTFRARIRGETHMFENSPFREDVTEEEYQRTIKSRKRKGKKKTPCEEINELNK